MANTTYLRLVSRFFVLIFFTATFQSVLAEDMWKGVFDYQKKMADYGNPEAQVKLGEMYEEGHGTAQDYDMARQWYQKAADQGFAPAREKLTKLQNRRQREAEAKRKAEEERKAREQAEQERLAREKAAAAERERQAQQEKGRQASEAEQKRLAEERAAREAEDKVRREEEERVARERARAAMEKMMSTPSAYTED